MSRRLWLNILKRSLYLYGSAPYDLVIDTNKIMAIAKHNSIKIVA